MDRPLNPHPSPAAKRPGRGRLRRMAYALAAALTALAALDQGVGLYLRRNWIRRVTMRDPTLLMRLKPGAQASYQVGQMTGELWGPAAPGVSISINSDGYRGQQVPRTKDPGEFRVVCLGDSITMGLDVDEDYTYASFLSRLLAERLPGRKVTVINAGALSYSSRQGLYLFRDKFLDYQPDVVIWGFGFNDHGRPPALAPRDVDLVPLEPGGTVSYPAWKKHLFLWVSNRPLVQGVYAGLTPIVWRAQSVPLLTRLSKLDQLPAEKLSPEQFERVRVPPREYEVHLLEMGRLAQTRGFRLIVPRFLGTNSLYAEISRRFCDAHGAAYLDFAAMFGAAAQSPDALGRPPYGEMFEFYRPGLSDVTLEKFPLLKLTTDNLHPNNLGHRLIAVSLADVIIPAPDKGEQ